MSKKGKSGKALGRGISALMGDIGLEDATGATSPSAPETEIPIEQIAPNPLQPRRSFPEDTLQELATSIRSRGIVQPIIVRETDDRDSPYQIVAGERRWRAAQLAQLHSVPAIVRRLSDPEVFEIALIENIQRERLNPIEEAQGYRQLIDQFNHSQDALAGLLGKSRSHIANSVRLLGLPEDVRSLVAMGQLSAGHARALITAADPSDLAKLVVSKGLSVRETERLAKAAKTPKRGSGAPSRRQAKDSDTIAIENDLAANLGMGVSINHKDIDGAGEVVIRYRSLDQLDVLCQMLSAIPPDESR